MQDASDRAEADRLSASVRACETRLDEIESANRVTRWLLAGASAGLLVMAALFGLTLWRTLERQVTAEGVEQALQTKFETIGPPLGEKLVAEVMGAVPAYSDLAMERVMRVLPELSAGVTTEVESFAEETEELVRGRSEAAMQRVAKKLADDLKRDFPKLTESRVEQLAERLRDGLMSEGAGLGEELQQTILSERQRLAAMLDKLPIDAAMSESESQLQKRFIHNVLMMVDAAVEEWPTDEEIPSAALRSGG